jgi:hypothetical protein
MLPIDAKCFIELPPEGVAAKRKVKRGREHHALFPRVNAIPAD